MFGLLSKGFGKVFPYILAFVLAAIATYGARRVLTGRARAIATWVGVIGSAFALAILAGKMGIEMPQVSSDSPHQRGVDVMKAALAITSLSLVFYEIRRAGECRPVAERWKKFVGVSFGVAGILFYFNTLKFGYPQYYHRWDQYHYYMGAKYFDEIGYDGLYKCSAIAQDEIGRVQVDVEGDGNKRWFDLRQEVRKHDKKIRNLSGDNLLMKVDDLLAHPEQCTTRFTPERWEQYKKDVTFFSTQCYLDSYWTNMQQDHGYNPPPVWTIAGKFLGNLWTGDGVTIFGKHFEMHQRTFVQGLALIDVLYMLGAFVAIYWAFGWRAFAVSAIFFGTQSSAPMLWTGGALLRQDWLFFFVLSACLARKKYWGLSAAAMVYAGLLRVFPGLVVIGWLCVAGWHIAKYKRMSAQHLRMLAGGTVAAGVLIGASLLYVGKDSYQKFYHHTIDVHDQTPLTNHMGLRVLLGHDVGFDKESGRMRYTRDNTKTDPFQTWKDMRVQRYKDYKPVAYTLLATTLFAFAMVLRRWKSMWIAQTLGGIWIILLSQLTCYYYSYMLMYGTLTTVPKIRRSVEVYLFAFCAVSQFGWRTIGYNDDRYTYLTLISLVVSYIILFLFAPRELTWKERAASTEPAWKNLSGYMLGSLVSFAPGLVMVVQALLRKDWSSLLLGGIAMATGVALYFLAIHKRGPKPGAVPVGTLKARTP
ncbi:MAG: hypothetical protein HOW73_30115 [Polyangiaceae bacterium]|nr:hypothetical protein [Polyangiaceae bacterium]